MLNAAICVLGFLHSGDAPVSLDQHLSGTWKIVGNNYRGDLVIRRGKCRSVTGTIYGNPIYGEFDSRTNRVTFRRMKDENDSAGAQLWTGTLSQVRGSNPPRYELKGTYVSIAGPDWGGPGVEYSWTSVPGPRDDLKAMQGRWEVARTIACINRNTSFPPETGLGAVGASLTVRGNELLWNDQVVATLTNDLPADELNADVGFRGFRLVVLNLPDGKGLPCSYAIRDGGVELAYPHTTSCHRGSGNIVYLKRPAQ